MNNFKKAYHFCTKEFYEKLKEKQIIKADNRKSTDNNKFAYNYLFEEKNINNGNGMFFLWSDLYNKGYNIKYCSEVEANYVLLELDIPKDIAIDTNYDNWCSFIMDLYEADGDCQLADKIYREQFGIKNGLEGSYNSIYDINLDTKIIQILVPYLDYNWIKSIKYTKNKVA